MDFQRWFPGTVIPSPKYVVSVSFCLLTVQVGIRPPARNRRNYDQVIGSDLHYEREWWICAVVAISVAGFSFEASRL